MLENTPLPTIYKVKRTPKERKCTRVSERAFSIEKNALKRQSSLVE